MSDYGFNRNHYYLIAAAVAVFAVLAYSQSGIKLSAMFGQAEEDQPMLTYEQVRGEVYADMNIGNDEQYLAELEQQFALLDRGQANGAVLGQAIGIGAVPSSDQIFSREVLDQIKLNTTNDNSKESFQKYAELIVGAEAESNAVLSIANMNSSDAAALAQSKDLAAQVVAKLGSISVPSQLADFHRYKMIYYQNMGALAGTLSNPEAGQDLQNQTAIFLSVMEKIEQTKTDIWNSHQVQL